MTAAAAAAEQAAAFAEQMAEKAAEAEAAAVAEAERLAAAAPAATATPPLAVTQRPLKELSIINEGSMEHGSMIEGSAAWEATSYEAELERKARAAGARARAAERLRMKQAREEQAQQALEESASQLFENEERRALADARAYAARERAAAGNSLCPHRHILHHRLTDPHFVHRPIAYRQLWRARLLALCQHQQAWPWLPLEQRRTRGSLWQG